MTVALNNQRSHKDSQEEARSTVAEHIVVAGIITYYTILFIALYWLFLDVNLGNFWVVDKLTQVPEGWQWDPRFGYVAIGGALGSVVYSMRMLHKFYIGNQWDNRWLGKYITAPLEGSVLAVIVYVLLQGSVAVVGLHSGDYDPTTTNPMTAFGISLLVGFSMRDAVKWIDAKTKKLFEVKESEEDKKIEGDATGGQADPATV